MQGKMIAAIVAADVLGNVAEAFAASAREDNSSLVVWIFLGFCALIIIAQLLPVLRTLLESARAHRERRYANEMVQAPVPAKEKKS